MPAAIRVGMGKFVDENDLRPPGNDGVDIHFLKPLALVFDTPARDDLEASSRASVSLRPCVSTTPTTTS